MKKCGQATAGIRLFHLFPLAWLSFCLAGSPRALTIPAKWKFRKRQRVFAFDSTRLCLASRPRARFNPRHNFCNRAKVRVTVWTSLRESWRGRPRVLAWLFRPMRLTNCVYAFWWLLAKVLRHDLKRASLYLRSNWTSFVNRINSQSFI